MDASAADQAAELTLFRDTVRRFFAAEVVPHIADWRRAGMVAREAWRRAGAAGLLCASMPAEFGGGGDFRHEAILIEELATIGFGDFAISLHNAIIAPYILHYGTAAQKRRWLPRMARGEMIAAIAMTEPDAGSDLQAIRTTARRVGETYVVSGQKTFISNGQLADIVIVAAKTRADAGAKGISLIAVETADTPGFRRGRNLEKIGKHAQDTSELFFDDVVVPAENLLGGEPDRGFAQLMQQLPQERLVIAVGAVAAMEAALAETIAYARSRRAFGKTLLDFQNSRFVLAEAKTTTHVARVFVDDCIKRLLAGTLDVSTAAMAKYWTSEMQGKMIDACLQLFGGYGYMAEYPIAHRYTDARVQRIYGGSNEIMKELIARGL